MSIFSKTLVSLRKESGFNSAHSFFLANGGEKAFKMTYANYAMVEQGRHLPAFERLAAIIFGLRLYPASRPARDLTLAWLRTAHGDDAFRDVLAPLLRKNSAGKGAPSALVYTLQRYVANTTVHATPEQAGAVLESRDSLLCSLILSNSRESWSAKELAPAAGITPEAAQTALQSLNKAGVLNTSHKPGYYVSPWASATVQFPSCNTNRALFDRLTEWERELRKGGETLYERRLILRLDPDELHDLYLLISSYLDAAKVYAAEKKSEEPAWIYIEGRVVRFKDF